MANARSTNSRHRVKADGFRQLPDPLLCLLKTIVNDPTTDERVRRWLTQLLDNDAAEGEQDALPPSAPDTPGQAPHAPSDAVTLPRSLSGRLSRRKGGAQ